MARLGHAPETLAHFLSEKNVSLHQLLCSGKELSRALYMNLRSPPPWLRLYLSSEHILDELISFIVCPTLPPSPSLPLSITASLGRGVSPSVSPSLHGPATDPRLFAFEVFSKDIPEIMDTICKPSQPHHLERLLSVIYEIKLVNEPKLSYYWLRVMTKLMQSRALEIFTYLNRPFSSLSLPPLLASAHPPSDPPPNLTTIPEVETSRDDPQQSSPPAEIPKPRVAVSSSVLGRFDLKALPTPQNEGERLFLNGVLLQIGSSQTKQFFLNLLQTERELSEYYPINLPYESLIPELLKLLASPTVTDDEFDNIQELISEELSFGANSRFSRFLFCGHYLHHRHRGHDSNDHKNCERLLSICFEKIGSYGEERNKETPTRCSQFVVTSATNFMITLLHFFNDSLTACSPTTFSSSLALPPLLTSPSSPPLSPSPSLSSLSDPSSSHPPVNLRLSRLASPELSFSETEESQSSISNPPSSSSPDDSSSERSDSQPLRKDPPLWKAFYQTHQTKLRPAVFSQDKFCLTEVSRLFQKLVTEFHGSEIIEPQMLIKCFEEFFVQKSNNILHSTLTPICCYVFQNWTKETQMIRLILDECHFLQKITQSFEVVQQEDPTARPLIRNVVSGAQYLAHLILIANSFHDHVYRYFVPDAPSISSFCCTPSLSPATSAQLPIGSLQKSTSEESNENEQVVQRWIHECHWDTFSNSVLKELNRERGNFPVDPKLREQVQTLSKMSFDSMRFS